MTTVSSSTSTSGTISSLGIGSGLDVNSIISGLMKVEQAPLTDLTNAATTIQTSISAFGAVQSAVSSFRDAAAALSLPSTWNATTGTSSDPSSVTLTTTNTAATGNYAVAVQALATSQSTVSGSYTSGSSLVGAGTLHFDLGSWNSDDSAFTAQTDATTGTAAAGVDVVATATDTLATFASKVNAANAGVTASVVNDASGSRLVFSSTTTGLPNAFRVTATDSGGGTGSPLLSALAYNPPGGTTTTTITQHAANAAATVNGLSVSSATNTLSNVFDGLTINLGKVTAANTTVQVAVTQDTTAITKSVQGFVDAYNSLSTLLATDLKYDAGTKVSGPLQGDSTARSLQNQLRNIVGSSSGASSVFSTLSQVGIQVQTDGTLALDSTKLTAAMANPVELKKLFTNVDLNNANNDGIANQLRTFGDQVLGINGILTTRVAGLTTKLNNNQTDQASLNDRLASTQARLQAQYSALDGQMASISALGTYVTQQITNWNKSTS